MTGFASISGNKNGIDWIWEARSVNGRGLDLRVRLPEGADQLDAPLRTTITEFLSRGNVTVSLKFSRDETQSAPLLNRAALENLVAAEKEAQALAQSCGLKVAPVSTATLVTHNMVWSSATVTGAWIGDAKRQITPLLQLLAKARQQEGGAIKAMLIGQIDRLVDLVADARAAALIRNNAAGGILREKVTALLEITDAVDSDRLAQELAILAIKADITEELDRLDAHISAAQKLLAASGPVGRKFDFLMQEFNREANTLCSKSGSTTLTAVGLDLKLVIDQMREQVQNLE